MGSFIDEYWQTLWTGWTPVVVVGFFLMGVKLSNWIATYFNNPVIWFFVKFLLPFVLALSVPFWATYLKNK